MFGNLNKPAFGASTANTSFGFGTTPAANANPFGQNQLFGKPAATGFGTAAASTFGQTASTPLFPSAQPQTTSLFQNANTSFGASPNQSGFGTSNLFGQAQQQPVQPQQQAVQPTGLFGATSTFGQPAKQPGFGFGQQPAGQQPGLFGQQPGQPGQQPQQQALFQPSAGSLFGGGGAAFGAQQPQTQGTTVKFNPVTGTDTMMKNGVAQTINTKHHSITCMKEYENKSFEELRFEDYSANRKGPQQQQQPPGFGSTPFGAAASTAASLFGQPDAAKSAFGQSAGFGQAGSTFGQQSTAGFGMAATQQTGLFGKPTGFGAPTSSTASFGFGTTTAQTANPFGAAAAKPFGSASQPVFGTSTTATQQQAGFGQGLFGQPAAQNTTGTLFGKPAQPAQGFGAQPTSGFSFAAATSAAAQPTGLFSQPNKPLFGQTSTAGALGQSYPFGTSAFNKGSMPAFGTQQQQQQPAMGSTFGGLQTMGQTNALGSTQPGGLFGQSGATGLFRNAGSGFQSGQGFGLQPNQSQTSLFAQQEQQPPSNLALLTSDPFGDAPHLAGLEPKPKGAASASPATDPKQLRSLMETSRNDHENLQGSKLKRVPLRSLRDSLFENLTPKFNESSPADYVKTNCRRLVLKNPRPAPQGDDPSSPSAGLMRTDILKQLTSPIATETETETEARNDKSAVSTSFKTAPLRLDFAPSSEERSATDRQRAVADRGSRWQKNNNSLDSFAEKSTNATARFSDGDDYDDDVEERSDMAGGDALPRKQHRCGIVSTRPEYYVLPDPEELDKYVDESGSCVVKGFTIGRRGYGNVYYPDEMDVFGLNVDELVHFRYREVNVYPDESKKPPVGQGLNRKAQVTLDNVFPKQGAASDKDSFVKDPELLARFAEKLRKVTEKKGAKFVDYRPETGSWVFKVSHFSRYGYDDSDEESDTDGGNGTDQDKAQKRKQAAGKAEGKKDKSEPKETTHKSSSEREGEVSVQKAVTAEEEDDSNLMADVEDEEDLNGLLGLGDHDVDFRVIPDVPARFSYSGFEQSSNIQVMKSTLFADDDRMSDGGESQASIMRQYLDISDELPQLPMVAEESVDRSRKRAVLRPRVEKVCNFQAAETAVGVLEPRSYMDAALFKGKSFKVGWSRGFDFFTATPRTGEPSGQLSVNRIESRVAASSDPLSGILDKALTIVLEESRCEKDSQGVPTLEVKPGDEYLRRQCELFREEESAESVYLRSVWTLAEALWAPQQEETASRRRHLLSEWLKTNASFEDNRTFDSRPRSIFNLLTVFRIVEAANLALEERMPFLSLVISQLSLTDRAKALLDEQVESWYGSMASNHVSADFKRIYLLLSGLALRDEVNAFEDVDWKRAFGMHLWYLCPLGAPIETAIEAYAKAFEERGYARRPEPPYTDYSCESGCHDVLYHVLVLYRTRVHRLSSALNPLTHTSDPLDYRLSFLLLQLFLSLEVGIVSDSEKAKICVSVSNQLESLDDWEWSVFPLLYLKDNRLKKNLIVRILDRNLSTEMDARAMERQDFLVKKLSLPAEWLHLVKADKNLSACRYFEAFNNFALGKNYNKANDILMEQLLPSLFVNEQYDVINTVISKVMSARKEVSNWENRVGLFGDFLRLQEDFISFRVEDLVKLQAKLRSISERIGLFMIENDQQRLCFAEMSKRCASVYKEICKRSKSGVFKNSYSDFVDSLVMPPDFKQDEAVYLIDELNKVSF